MWEHRRFALQPCVNKMSYLLLSLGVYHHKVEATPVLPSLDYAVTAAIAVCVPGGQFLIDASQINEQQ